MVSAKLPTPNELKAVGRQLGMSLSDADVAFFLETMGGTVAAYHAIEAMADPMPAVKYPRTPGYRPEGEENKYNAWYYKSEVQGAPAGKLKGKRIALKDNVCLAGVPMMNGASTLEGYVPDVDATIVTRMLDAGGTILGKVHCEYFCFSGGSHTSAAGPVQNPRKPGYSAGGSSSGGAAVVAAGEADMAIGGARGGSTRIPAAYCGVYGLKPTHGLVPYTGVFPIEMTLDHTGPMTATVADNALLLEVLAGPDGLDPRQVNVKTAACTNALTGDARGMKIAVVKEGFGHANSEADVDALVRKASATFKQLGARVDEVSIPLHLARRRHLDTDRRRGRDAPDAERQPLRLQLEGPLCDEPHRRALIEAPPRRRVLRYAEDDGPLLPVRAQQVPRPLLREVPEPGPHSARRLRRGAEGLRPATDADPADQGHASAVAR